MNSFGELQILDMISLLSYFQFSNGTQTASSSNGWTYQIVPSSQTIYANVGLHSYPFNYTIQTNTGYYTITLSSPSLPNGSTTRTILIPNSLYPVSIYSG